MKHSASKLVPFVFLLLSACAATPPRQVYINDNAAQSVLLDLPPLPPLDLTPYSQPSLNVITEGNSRYVQMPLDDFLTQLQLINVLSDRIYLENDYILQYRNYYESPVNYPPTP